MIDLFKKKMKSRYYHLTPTDAIAKQASCGLTDKDTFSSSASLLPSSLGGHSGTTQKSGDEHNMKSGGLGEDISPWGRINVHLWFGLYYQCLQAPLNFSSDKKKGTDE